MLAKINHEQRLYVLTCGDGYTCLGFDVCEARIRALVADLKRTSDTIPPGTNAAPGTEAHYRAYETLCNAAHERFVRTGVRSTSELTPQLIGLEGKRVEVVDRNGETRRFIVGRSTGHIPCHIELKRRDSSGGSGVYGAPFASVRVLETIH